MSAIFRKQSAAKQLSEQLKLSIQQGKWLGGAQLPTIRKLAEDYQVSLNTVHASLKQLEDDELIECRPRQGTFVKAVSQWADHISASAPRQVAVIRPVTPGEDPTVDETQQTGLIIHGIEQGLEAHDLHIVLLSFELSDPHSSEKLLRQIERLRPQLTGVIAFAVGALQKSLFGDLDRLELPWVTVNRLDSHTLENFVSADGVQCGEVIGRCIAAANAARVLLLGQRTQMDIERIAGILRGYWEKSHALLDVQYLFVPDWREAPAYETTLRYLKESPKPLPQMVIGLGDIIAVGAMRAMASQGVRIPDDLAVLSTTDLAIASFSRPTLSAFHIPISEIGRDAAAMLVQMLSSGQRRLPGRFVSGRMIFRQSFPARSELREAQTTDTADNLTENQPTTLVEAV